MNVLIFRDFSGFFRINFAIFNVKNNLKIKQKGFCFRAGPTWVRHGTQGHAGPPGAYAARCDVCIFIYIVSIWFIVHISLPIIGNTLPLISVASYKPAFFF